MRESATFGSLLRSFRIRLGGPRHSIEWLASRLTYPTSTIYGWETGDPSKGLPSRSTIISIARLYSLSIDETNELIMACGAQRKRPAHMARYAPLSPDEVERWTPMQGPALNSIGVWRDQLEASQAAYISGELRSARRLAESILLGIEASENSGDDLWSREERDEMSRLWMLAWREYFEASALLETDETVAHACKHYLSQARHRVSSINDLRLRALAVHLEGDYHHLQGQHATAMDLHLQARQQLGSFETDPSLAVMIQRLIILDGAHVLAREQLADHVRKGRLMAERLSPQDRQARILVSEAAGRALGMIGNPDCWSLFSEAESESLHSFPVGHVTTLYSRMVALASAPHLADLDQLRAVGTYALIAATHNGWQRRRSQIMQLGATNGIELHAVP